MLKPTYRFFNYFVPDVFRTSNALHTQAVILVSVVAFTTAISLFGLLYIQYGLPGLDQSTRRIGRYFVIFTISVYLIARLFYYRFHMLQAAGHIVTFGLFSSTLGGILVTGGYTQSPLPVLLIIPPVFAFLMMGLKPGLAWSLLSLGTLIGIWVLELFNLFKPIQLLNDATTLKSLSLAVPLAAGMIVTGGIAIYELITNGLRIKLQHERNKFKWEATHDALTGLPNRPEFFHRLQLGMRNAEVNQQALALVYLDLDGFKPINDRHGHDAGDEVLTTVSKKLQDVFRGSDIVCRLGGDEFAVILQGINTNADLMKNILSKALRAISEEMMIDGKLVRVGASMGVAYYTEQNGYANELCRKADLALYKAKENKNTWCIYGEEPLTASHHTPELQTV